MAALCLIVACRGQLASLAGSLTPIERRQRHRDGVGRRIDQTPRVRLFENPRGERRVQRVPGPVRHDVPDDGVSDQREIADDVEHLVTDELVLEPERIEHTGFAQHDRVVERAAERQAVLTERLDLFEETERTGRRDLLAERLFRDPHRPRLMAQERVIEADAVGDLEVVGRIERNALVAARQRDGPDHFQVSPGRREPLRARLVYEVDERRAAAVHDRHLGVIQLDNHVVDAQTHERRHEVLHRVDRCARARQARGVLDAGEVRHRGGNLEIAEVGAPETNAEIRRGGPQRQPNLVS